MEEIKTGISSDVHSFLPLHLDRMKKAGVQWLPVDSDGTYYFTDQVFFHPRNPSISLSFSLAACFHASKPKIVHEFLEETMKRLISISKRTLEVLPLKERLEQRLYLYKEEITITIALHRDI